MTSWQTSPTYLVCTITCWVATTTSRLTVWRPSKYSNSIPMRGWLPTPAARSCAGSSTSSSSRALTSFSTAIRADARWPDQILDHAEVKGLLDFSQPVGVLLLSLLHAIPDDEEAYGVARTLRDRLASGSYIAISHTTYYKTPFEVVKKMEEMSARTPTPGKIRSKAEIQRFFDGLEMVEPGLTHLPLWRPEGPEDVLFNQPGRSLTIGGVGRKVT